MKPMYQTDVSLEHCTYIAFAPNEECQDFRFYVLHELYEDHAKAIGNGAKEGDFLVFEGAAPSELDDWIDLKDVNGVCGWSPTDEDYLSREKWNKAGLEERAALFQDVVGYYDPANFGASGQGTVYTLEQLEAEFLEEVIPTMINGWLLRNLNNGFYSVSNPGTGAVISFPVAAENVVSFVKALK